MSNARKLADNLPTEGQLGNRNMIINGALNIAQRSQSAVTVSDGSNEGYATVDRFQVTFGSAMGGALSAQQVDSPSGNSEFGKSLKLSCTTVNSAAMGSGSNRFLSVAQYLEGLDLQHLGYGQTDAKDLAFSFWVYTNKTGRYGFSIIAQDSGGSYDVWGSNFNVTTANTWQKVIFTIEGNTSANIIATNTYGFLIDVYLAVASNRAGTSDSQWQTYSTARVPGAYTDYVDFLDNTSNVFYITGVQLEVGSQASPFEHEPTSVTLAKCQRYYFQEDITTTNASGGLGVAAATTAVTFDHPLPVRMRANPSVSLTSANLRIGDTVSAAFYTSSGSITISSYSGPARGVYNLNGFSGLTTYRTYLHEPDSTYPGIVVFNAEL